MPYEVVFTDSQFCAFLEHIASDLPTGYNNTPYYNCGYYTGTKWTFDCWNLIKSVIWGWNADTTVGSYTYDPGKYGLGDWNGVQLLSHCDDVSNDFSNVVKGEYLYMSSDIDHAGVTIDEKTINGNIYNVVEATPIWNDGVQYSYMDSMGRRFDHKDGTQVLAWTSHGKLPWIEYNGSPPKRKLPIWLLLRYHF